MKIRGTSHSEAIHSIFVDLLLILLIALAVIHVFIGGVFSLLSRPRTERIIESNLRHYAEQLVKEIGAPPDTVKARQLADAYQLVIRYESADLTWSNDHRFINRNCPSLFKYGPSQQWRKPLVIENADGSRFLLVWRVGPAVGMHRELFAALAAAVTVIILCAALLIRRMLRPVQWLQNGATEVAAGNLDVAIPIRRNDELGRLTAAFNSMTRQIKEMLKARDRLLLDVSHELRSPLTRIKMALEFIPDGPKKESILSDVSEIEAMITEILETERLNNAHGRLKKMQTDIIPLIREVSKPLTDTHPGMTLPSKPASLLLKCDAERVRLVLKNVFENALKFSLADSQPVEVSLEESDRVVLIMVRDDGMGIPADRIADVFEPFYRVDPARLKSMGGYGLGLHLCKKIMDAHGGKIQISGNDGRRGVTVRLEFTKRA
jgi:signal transduction histidine kinase